MTAAPQPAPMTGGPGGVATPGAGAPGMGGGMMPAMVMPLGQPQQSGPDYPEGGGTSPNANVPGNQTPNESKGVAPLYGLPDPNQSTTKPRQTPGGSGGGDGMGLGMDESEQGPSGDAEQDASGSASTSDSDGGADQMKQDSGSENAYTSKRRAIVADVLAANPGMDHRTANKIASRVLKTTPGLVVRKRASDEDTDPVRQQTQQTPQQADNGNSQDGPDANAYDPLNTGESQSSDPQADDQKQQSQPFNPNRNKVQVPAGDAEEAAAAGDAAGGAGAAAGAGEAAGAAAGAEGLVELLPLLAL